MAADPEFEHRVHRRLRRRPQDELHVELVESTAGDPEDVAFEALDVLRFLLELGFRDEDREVDLTVAGRVEFVSDRLVDQLHDRPSVGPPDVHPLDRIALVAEFRALDDLVVPLAELFVLPHGNATFKVALRLYPYGSYFKSCANLYPQKKHVTSSALTCV